MKHVMIDLETMSSAYNAAIVSIGAVFFDYQLGPTFKANISLESSQKAGLAISASTIEWWLKQSEAARAHLYSPPPADLGEVLELFSTFMRTHSDRRDFKLSTFVWGNGATFDNVILRNAYDALNIPCPWGFRYDACFRTLKTQFDPNGLLFKDPEIAHDSLADAIAQAEHAIRILNSLKVAA